MHDHRRAAPNRPEAVLCCCCSCPTPSASASALTCLGVCIVVLVYALLGACAFAAIEGTLLRSRPHASASDETSVAASQPDPSAGEAVGVGADLRSKTVERLWSITEDLNILYKDNWTRLAAREVTEFQETLVRAMRQGTAAAASSSSTGPDDPHAASREFDYAPDRSPQHKWSFASSFLYSLTLITTIGYGNVTPRTPAGKLATIAYALLGIPLMLVYLSTVGDVLARSFRSLYAKMCGPSNGQKRARPNKRPPIAKSNHVGSESFASGKGYYEKSGDAGGVVILDCVDLDPYPRKRHYHCGGDETRVPISLCALIVLAYVSLGAALFNRTENWSFLDGSYFCFTSLSTVGFGDLYPGRYASSVSAQAEDVALCACSAYILVGMAVVAMCFNLVQDEIIVLVRKFNRACGGRTARPRSIVEEDSVIGPVEDISMSSLVS